MTPRLLLIALAPFLLRAQPPAPALVLRGKQQSVTLLNGSASAGRPAVLFFPGDGGWRGLAVTIGETISSWGYDVYGFDTKRYLESFTQGSSRLTCAQMRQDLHDISAWIRARGAPGVVVLGWSEGAGMAVLAAQEANVNGVLTMGLPESAVLGWTWKDTLAVAARLEPDQPRFFVKPILSAVACTPLWMIHGSLDEYTSPQTERALYALAGGPKRLIEIDGANHRFDGRRGQLFRALREGLTWVSASH